jgi:5-methylcytosine-specific restriction enzyme subunit McrC
VRTITIPEFGRIERDEIGARLVKQLEAADRGRAGGRPVFDWSRRNYIGTTNYVGVIQVPGLIVEVVPKIDSVGTEGDPFGRARHNLIEMLTIAGELPIRHRDLAGLASRRKNLLDAFVSAFVNLLVLKLSRGVDHGYVRRREQARYLKGRLCLREHLLHNSVRRERFFVEYDEFVSDTRLNQILKWTCRVLGRSRSSPLVQTRLDEALASLSEVQDLDLRVHHFDEVFHTRNTERFRPLLDFCRLIWEQSCPEPVSGGVRSFSLMFPMESVFERFITAVVRREAVACGLDPTQIRTQGRGITRWLLREEGGRQRLRLKPDLLITDRSGSVALIIDTKWKIPKQSGDSSVLAVSDAYQLYAYANRYSCPDNIVLMPKTSESGESSYTIEGNEEERRLRIEFVDLSRDLRREFPALRAELRRVIGLDAVDSDPSTSATSEMN